MSIEEQILKRLDRIQELAEANPWSLPLSDDWSIDEEQTINWVLKPGESLMLADVKANGYLKGFVLISNSPKVRMLIKLAIPGGVVADYNVTCEELATYGFDSPPGNYAPYVTKFDPVNNIYAVRVSPPFPGPAFRGRATFSLTNEAATPSLIILAEYALLLIKNG